MTHDVINKNFTATQFRRGYDEREVDDYLDELVLELRRLTNDNDDLRGLIPPEARDKVAAARVSAENAEQNAATRIAKANAAAERAEADAAERVKAASGGGEETARSVRGVVAPAPARDVEQRAAELTGAALAGPGSVAGVLALAQKLHDEYVREGEATLQRLISDGHARHDQFVAEAEAKHEELVSTGQATYDEFVSTGQATYDELVSTGQATYDELVLAGGAKHDALVAEADALIAEASARHEHMITEAQERSSGMLSDANQKRADILQVLESERGLLQSEIQDLRKFAHDHRARLNSYLEGLLIDLKQTGAAEAG